MFLRPTLKLNMEGISNEYHALRKRHHQAYNFFGTCVDDMLKNLQKLRHQISNPPPSDSDQSTHMDVDSISDPALVPLQKLLQDAKSLQASLVTDYKVVGTTINKLGKAIDVATCANLGDICAPSVRLSIPKINDAIAAHLFREGMFDVGRTFLQEAAVRLDDSHIRPFERLYHILTAFQTGHLTPAIEWTKEHATALRFTASHLEFRLHRLAYLHILERGHPSEALAYAQTHLSAFPEHIAIVQKLITCLLYAATLSTSPYKDLVDDSHKDDIARSLSQEYCRVQGFSLDSSLVTVMRCGARAIPTLLKASRVAPNLQELGMDDALPVEIDVGRECQFHSIFTCPVSKEEASEGNNVPMILPCGHVLSKQSIARLPRGSPRFKCPYCPMEQMGSECRELYF